uniref:Uncharacterized protein n=1 Tax=Sphingobacterium sp. (strain 21) TaxID=743722 RepID=F4CEI7_SPHS2
MKILGKIKEAIKKVNSIALGGLLVAGGLAVGFTPEKVEIAQDEVLWGRRQSGGWVQTTPSAGCSSGAQDCKRLYPQGQDPNDDETGGIQFGTANGYVAP